MPMWNNSRSVLFFSGMEFLDRIDEKRPLKRLIDLGLVYRDIPFGNDEKGNKRTLYKLSDPFLRFWYAFALPRYSNPRFLSSDADRESLRLPFRVFQGMPGRIW